MELVERCPPAESETLGDLGHAVHLHECAADYEVLLDQ
jgi:hypothetical protein